MMEAKLVCPSCGYENREGTRFCQKCGAKLSAPKQPTKPLSRASGAQSGIVEGAGNQVRRDRPQDGKSGTTDPSTGTSLPETQPLPDVDAGFAPLPQGALLNDGRYVVLEERSANEQLNVYLVEDARSKRLCPNCQAEVADPAERYCSFCGADLADVEPVHLRRLARESADEQAFAAEAKLLAMQLEHSALLLPHDVFRESPYGPPRHYLVASEYAPSQAETLSVPQELNRVLSWGVSLARALEYLHRNEITLHGAGLKHIAVEEGEAYWTDLGVADVVSRETKDYFTRDVRGLASALLYLATGQWQYTDEVPLPDRAREIFSRALAMPEAFTASTFAQALEEALEEIRRPESVTFVVGRRTDVGKQRALNEDSLFTLDLMSVFRSLSEPMGLFAVADGMGGHEAGDVASQLALRTVARRAVDEVLAPLTGGKPLTDIEDWLTSAVQAANRAVYDERTAAGTDMGATLVMALVVGDEATIANVGDSRAYLLDEEHIEQITTDHSLVERLVATGQITREEIADHPQKNVIYRVIGDKPRVQVDLFERTLAVGSGLLLCSDGLSGMVTDEQIWQIWRTSTSPQEACDRLVEAANQAGGEDNIAVVIVQIGR